MPGGWLGGGDGHRWNWLMHNVEMPQILQKDNFVSLFSFVLQQLINTTIRFFVASKAEDQQPIPASGDSPTVRTVPPFNFFSWQFILIIFWTGKWRHEDTDSTPTRRSILPALIFTCFWITKPLAYKCFVFVWSFFLIAWLSNINCGP